MEKCSRASKLCAPLEDGLVAVTNEDVYSIQIADPAKNARLLTIRRDYRTADAAEALARSP